MIRDERAVSVAVNHVLAIGISTILIVGLLTAAGGLFQDEQRSSVQNQLEMVGEKMANDIEHVDSLGERGAKVSVNREYVGRISGKTYNVELETGSQCDAALIQTDSCLVLSSPREDVSVTVGLTNQSSVGFTDLGSGKVRISSAPSGNPGIQPFGPSVTWSTGVSNNLKNIPPSIGSGNVTLNRKPEANLSMDPERAMLGDILVFNASNSTDDNNNIVKYIWNFTGGQAGDDPGEFNATTTDPTYSVPTDHEDISNIGLWAGQFHVNLTVVDGGGKRDSIEPHHSFTVAGLVQNGRTVSFDTDDGIQYDRDPNKDWEDGETNWILTGENETAPGGVRFDVKNLHDDQIEIRKLIINPENPDITRIDDDPVVSGWTDISGFLEPTDYRRDPAKGIDDDWALDYHEIEIANGYMENTTPGGGIDIRTGKYEQGRFLKNWGDTADASNYSNYPTISADSDSDVDEVEFREFRAEDPSDKFDSINMSGEPITIDVWYKETGSDSFFVSSFNVTPEEPFAEVHNANYHESTKEGKKINLKAGPSEEAVESRSWDIIDTSDQIDPSKLIWTDEWDDQTKRQLHLNVDIDGPDEYVIVEATVKNSIGTRKVRWYIDVEDKNGGGGGASGPTDPSATFTYTPMHPDKGETIHFDGSNSSDPDKSIKSHEWDLDGDGNVDKTGVAEIDHSYPVNGTYDVTLTVTDTDGFADTETKTVIVGDGNQPPTASFTANTTTAKPGDSIAFDGSNSNDPDGTITSYEWDFNSDGTVDATGQSVTHAYSTTGNYTVSLTVTDGSGATNTTTSSITVEKEPPNADFTFSPSNPTTADSITFDASNSNAPDGTITSYEWDFDGDGTFDDTGATTSHNYSTSGDYDVTLKVTDDNGNTNKTTRTVPVSETPSFTDLWIQDDSDDGGWFWWDDPEAIFDVGYTVSDPDTVFKKVTVTFENLNNGDTEIRSSTALDDTLSYSKEDNYNDDYEITVRMYDSNGNLVFEQTYTETADGTDENGNVI